MNQQELLSCMENPGEMSVISASKKYVEVLRAVHETWANQEPDYELDLTGYDFYAKDLFMNDYFLFFSAVQGNVKNRTSPILNPELRTPLVSNAKKMYQDFAGLVHSTSHVPGDEERMLAIKNAFSTHLMSGNFPESSREAFEGLRPEVEQLDSWVADIISEVVTSSHFGLGAPSDPHDAVFYLYVKDKDEHVAASLLIGASFIEEWLSVSPVRGIIGRNELDDDEAFDRESQR
jgi:hypothetical protein